MLEKRTQNNHLLKVNVCLDYSGQWDIAQSCKKLMKEYHLSQLQDEDTNLNISIESVIHGIFVLIFLINE